MSYTTTSPFRARLIYTTIAAVLGLAGSAQATPLSPSLKLLPIQSFTGVLDSIPVPVGDGTIETGPISVTLDTEATNLFGLDNELSEGYIDVTLILSSPLLDEFGETPRIRIVEAGPAFVGLVNPQPSAGAVASAAIAGSEYCECDCGNDFDFFFFAGLTGGGVVADGIFQGTIFQNVNAYQGQGLLGSWIVKPYSIVTWDLHKSGSVTFPDGPTVTGIGGRGTLVVTPEPASWVLAALGLAATGLLGRRKMRRTADA